jgi:hypothetical protein
MPRNTTPPKVVLALSRSQTSFALGVPVDRINDAVDRGELIVRIVGRKARIAVFGPGGIQEWFLSCPEQKKRKSPDAC